VTPFKNLDKRGRSIVGYAIVAFLLGIGITAYFMLQSEGGTPKSFNHEIAEEGLREGINQYRLQNYERARLLLLDMIQNAREKRTASMAALYLGNIAFLKGDLEDALQFYEQSLAVDRKNLFAPFNAAVTAAKMGDWRKALAYYRKTGSLESDFAPAALLLANIYYGAQRYSRAAELYNRAAHADPLFLYNQARALLREGQRWEAMAILGAIARDAESAELLRGLSAHDLAMLEFGVDSGKALAYMEQAAEVFPSSEAVQFNTALLLVREGRYGDAIGLLRLWDFPKRGATLLEGYALFRSGRYGEALDLWERAYTDERDARIARILGDIHFTLGNWKEAESYYRMALEEPGHLEVLENLVQVFVNTGELERAAEACAEYAERAVQDPAPLICLADLSFRLERVQTAKGALSRARELIGDEEVGLLRVGSVYARYGLYNSALSVYQQVVEHHPESAEAYGRIGEIYYLGGHPLRAREYLQRASVLTTDPELFYRASLYLILAEGGNEKAARLGELARTYPHRYEAYYDRALALLEEGEYGSARQTIDDCLEKATTLDDATRSRLLALSGIVSAKSGDKDGAARLFTEAQRLDSGNELALVNMRMIREAPF
jgi:tetratricopeptide (TPR) repeat protein